MNDNSWIELSVSERDYLVRKLVKAPDEMVPDISFRWWRNMEVNLESHHIIHIESLKEINPMLNSLKSERKGGILNKYPSQFTL